VKKYNYEKFFDCNFCFNRRYGIVAGIDFDIAAGD
jgi:hypothetical protein